MQDSAALIVALRHNSFQDAAVVCRLLCVGKAVRSLILEQGLGQLSLEISWQNVGMVQGVGQWMQQHGQLVKSLSIDLHDKQAPMHAGFIAASLHEAAAAGLLRLQSVNWGCGAALGLTLQQMSPQFLTELGVTFPKLRIHSVSRSDQQVLTALSQLTNLQKLRVYRFDKLDYVPDDVIDNLDPLIPALAPLVKLTKLDFCCTLQDWHMLHRLPYRLQQLEMGMSQLEGPALQLNQLTALTCFVASGWPLDREGLTIRETDILPPALRKLCVKDCLSCKPLLQLRHLQELYMCQSTTSASGLKQLSQLTTLTDVSLKYDVDEWWESGSQVDDKMRNWVAAFQRNIAAAANGWSSVPGLRSLDFGMVVCNSNAVAVPMSAATIKGMGNVSCLQSLFIDYWLLSEEALIELQSSLQRMTALVSIEVHLMVGRGEGQNVLERTLASSALRVDTVLASILASLPMLRCLTLHSLEVSGKAASVLSSATNLKALNLNNCDIVDEEV